MKLTLSKLHYDCRNLVRKNSDIDNYLLPLPSLGVVFDGYLTNVPTTTGDVLVHITYGYSEFIKVTIFHKCNNIEGIVGKKPNSSTQYDYIVNVPTGRIKITGNYSNIVYLDYTCTNEELITSLKGINKLDDLLD